jgi:hypothetical protein
MGKADLKIDWATHEAAKFACENWHYSRCLPAGKLVKIGAWEDGKFIGVVLFGRGATPNIGSPYGLQLDEVCELVRIALTKHKTPVSRILSLALRWLKKSNNGLRLLVSYSDCDQNHHGGIYQATNWIFTGCVNQGSRSAFVVNGKKMHPRSIGARGGIQSLEWVRKNLDQNASEFLTTGKNKYLMPLDDEMRRRLIHLSKPYPKRAGSDTKDTAGFQPAEGGSTPTPALHSDG